MCAPRHHSLAATSSASAWRRLRASEQSCTAVGLPPHGLHISRSSESCAQFPLYDLQSHNPLLLHHSLSLQGALIPVSCFLFFFPFLHSCLSPVSSLSMMKCMNAKHVHTQKHRTLHSQGANASFALRLLDADILDTVHGFRAARPYQQIMVSLAPV